jgi:DNA-binding response OmpR family regulator
MYFQLPEGWSTDFCHAPQDDELTTQYSNVHGALDDMNTVRHLLIVDDEPAILFAFSQFLKAPGIHIDTAETAEAAIDLIERKSIDAAIVDLRLTGAATLEGLDVIRRLKERQPSCVVLVVTAFGGDEIKTNVRRMGADHYFEKPVSPDKLRETLKMKGIY